MDGPRAVRTDELPSLSRLVDTVFGSKNPGDMFRYFPTFFTESNRDNLFVFVQDHEVISHVGMTLHQASLAGCTVGVACIGAVSTYEEYRGKGLASRLLEHACKKARDWGANLMMISGGLGLYRRLGAADVGGDFDTTVTAEVAKTLSAAGFSLTEFAPEHLETYAKAYQAKAAHFVRPHEEWRALTEARVCMCRDVDILSIAGKNSVCAYLVAAPDTLLDAVRVFEFAGRAEALAAALRPLLQRYGLSSAKLRVPADNNALRTLLEKAGASLRPTTGMGTLLLLDIEGLFRQLRPLIESRLGPRGAQAFQVQHEPEGRVVFRAGDKKFEVDGIAEAAQVIFGHPDRLPAEGDFGRLFPVPSLEYGLNYV